MTRCRLASASQQGAQLVANSFIHSFAHLPMRGIAMCIKWACSWSCADASSAWSPSRSLPRTSWGTLHPHPFRSANRVKRKDESRSCATGSNGLRSAKAFGFPSSSSCATVRASCATGVPCSSAILPNEVVYKAEIRRGQVGFYAFAIRVEIVANKWGKDSRFFVILVLFPHARAQLVAHRCVFSLPCLMPRHGWCRWNANAAEGQPLDLPRPARELTANGNCTILHRRRLPGTVPADKMDAVTPARRYRGREWAPTVPPPRYRPRPLIGQFRTRACAHLAVPQGRSVPSEVCYRYARHPARFTIVDLAGLHTWLRPSSPPGRNIYTVIVKLTQI